MLKTLAIASIAMGGASALNVDKTWTSYDISDKTGSDYIGSSDISAYDGKAKAYNTNA